MVSLNNAWVGIAGEIRPVTTVPVLLVVVVVAPVVDVVVVVDVEVPSVEVVAVDVDGSTDSGSGISFGFDAAEAERPSSGGTSPGSTDEGACALDADAGGTDPDGAVGGTTDAELCDVSGCAWEVAIVVMGSVLTAAPGNVAVVAIWKSELVNGKS